MNSLQTLIQNSALTFMMYTGIVIFASWIGRAVAPREAHATRAVVSFGVAFVLSVVVAVRIWVL